MSQSFIYILIASFALVLILHRVGTGNIISPDMSTIRRVIGYLTYMFIITAIYTAFSIYALYTVYGRAGP